MDLQLKGKVALVTGGSKGLGKASALALAREGCDVAIVARTAADLEEARREITALGVRCVAIPADLSQAAEIERCVRDTAARFERIDILVNCAGGAAAGGLYTVTDEQWQEAYDLKVLAYIRFTRSVAPIMQRQGGGRIILVSGTAGKQPSPYSLCIGALNATINNMARGLAEELAPTGIGVVAVSPGPTETERWPNLRAAAASAKGVTPDKAEQAILKGIPLGRIARSDEVGNLVAYLSSPLAAYMTGVNVVLDGGAVKVI